MALEIFRLVGSVFVDTDSAEKSLKKTDKNAEGLGTKLVNAGKMAGKFALAVGAAAVAAGAAIVGVTESTREYRTEQGKLQAAFETQNFSAQAARKTYEELNGILGDSGQAVEAANHLAQLANNEKDLAAWTDICTGVYATFGDSLPIEGLTEAANETARCGQLTGPLTDAINWAAKAGETFGVTLKANTKANEEWNKAVESATSAEDFFNLALQECSTEQERQALITKTLNGLYDEASDKYKEVNKDVIAANKAQDKLNEAMSKVGGALEPFVTKGKELVAKVLEKATPYIENLAEKALPWLEQKFEDLENVVGQVSDGIEWAVDKFKVFSDWCIEHQGTIETVGIVIGSFAAAWALVNTAVGIWTGVATAAAGATTALTTAISILTSPITIAIAIIGAIIAAGVLLWKNWDTVKAKAAELWQALTEKFQQIKETVVTKVTEIKDGAVQKFQEMKDGVERWVSNLAAKAKEKFESVKSTISLTISEAKQKVVDTFTGMYDSVVDKVTNIYSKVKEKFDAVKQAISDAIEAAKQKVSDVIDAIKDLFDFDFKLNIKLPHVTVDGGEAPWGIGGAGRLPSFDVKWYKKAMDEAMLLTDPTIFGYQDGKFLGGGEAGNEVVVGESHLMEMMAKVVASQTAARDERLIAVLSAILDAITEGNTDLLRALLAGLTITIGERDFKRMVREYA